MQGSAQTCAFSWTQRFAESDFLKTFNEFLVLREKSGLMQCGGLTLAKGQTPTQPGPHSSPAGRGEETNGWESSLVEVKTRRPHSSYCCRQNRLNLRKINLLPTKIDQSSEKQRRMLKRCLSSHPLPLFSASLPAPSSTER